MSNFTDIDILQRNIIVFCALQFTESSKSKAKKTCIQKNINWWNFWLHNSRSVNNYISDDCSFTCPVFSAWIIQCIRDGHFIAAADDVDDDDDDDDGVKFNR